PPAFPTSRCRPRLPLMRGSRRNSPNITSTFSFLTIRKSHSRAGWGRTGGTRPSRPSCPSRPPLVIDAACRDRENGRHAGERAREEDIVRLEAVLVREEEEVTRRTGPFRPTDSQFHRSVADCARNLPLIVLMNALADLTASAASALDSSVRARHRLKNCQFHRLIFEAIRARDGEAASRIMAQHVRDIQRRVHRSLKDCDYTFQ